MIIADLMCIKASEKLWLVVYRTENVLVKDAEYFKILLKYGKIYKIALKDEALLLWAI